VPRQVTPDGDGMSTRRTLAVLQACLSVRSPPVPPECLLEDINEDTTWTPTISMLFLGAEGAHVPPDPDCFP